MGNSNRDCPFLKQTEIQIGIDRGNEMFEELGYKRRADIDVIVYFQKFGLHYFKIMFDLSEKIVDIDTNF